MSDYISREAAVDMFQRFAYDDWNQGVGISLADAFYKSAEMIGTIPAADVVEVKHGEWIKGIHMVECSVCSDKFDFGDETWVDDYDIVADIGWKHCPNCGAKMDGERKVGDGGG